MKVYKFVLHIGFGNLEINFHTEQTLPFALGNFYYANLQFSEKQINFLDSVVGRNFQTCYPNWDRFSISEIKVHQITF